MRKIVYMSSSTEKGWNPFMDNPKVLVLDIETSPLEVYVWDIKDQYIAANQIIKDWYIMAWSAKWLNSDLIIYHDKRHDKTDKRIVQILWQYLDTADIVITQNGKAFDSKKINARFIMHGMRPPSPYKHLDTYLIAKNVAAFTSHSLDYLTTKLNTKYKKLSHSNFPGLSLWKECLMGNMKAWEEMKQYNKHDVLSTEELYNNFKAWVPQHMPNPEHSCPRRYAVKWDKRQNRDGTYQIYKCKKCAHKFKGEKIK